MIIDDERREVAARLREMEPLQFDDGEFIDCGEVADALGLVSDDGAWYKAEDVMRLADLIEPNCDRDALLELVKELELGAQCVVGRKWPDVECERMAKHLADDYEMIASRIREALGVADA